MRGCRPGGERDGTLEAGHGLDNRPTPLRGERTSSSHKLVRLHVRRGDARNGRRCERELEPVRDGTRDLVLDSEDVNELPTVPLRPQLVSVVHCHELRMDANARSCPPDAPLEYRCDVELLSHRVQLVVLALEREGKHARR